MLHIPLLLINKFNKTEFASFVPLMWYLFPKDLTDQNLFDFDIVHFHYLDGDVTRSISYCVYISQLIRFVRASNRVT